MKIRARIIGLIILLSAGKIFAAGRGESSAEQQLLIQSLVDAAESAARRSDVKTAQELVQQAYTDFAQYNKVSDEKKFEALGKIEEAARLASRAKPKQTEKKVTTADAEKERSILKTWLQNVKNIFDEKQALDLYERAKKDAAKFKHMSEEEIQNILQQIRRYIEFLRPAPKPVKQPTQQERKKEEGGKIIAPGGPEAPLRDITSPDQEAIKKAAANRAKLSPEQREDLDMLLWKGLISPNFGYGVTDLENDLKKGANPNAVIRKDARVYDIANQIAIEVLKTRNYKEYLKLLVKYGFDINREIIITDLYQAPTGSKTRVLLAAMKNLLGFIPYKNSYDLISFLLELGADPNMTESVGNTAFHYINEAGSQFTLEEYKNLIQLFINHGANINAENAAHQSPLTTAIISTNVNFAHALMEINANPFVGMDNNNDSLSALDGAINKFNEAMQKDVMSIQQRRMQKSREAFRKELEKYMKDYKESHRKEIREATAPALPVAQLPGVITEYLFGEEEKPAQEKE